MPRKRVDAGKPSESIAEYLIPDWELVKDMPVRQGSSKTFSHCGTYTDYAI
jgi:hypothetical protein